MFAWILTHQGEHTSSDLYGIPPHGVCHADELLYMWSPVFFDNYEFSGNNVACTELAMSQFHRGNYNSDKMISLISL